MIIGLIGEKLSGKDEAAKYMVEKHGAFHIKFSALLDEILNILDLPTTRRNEIDLGLGLRKIFGDGVLFNSLKKRAVNAKEALVVINGLRMDEQERAIRELGAKMIYLTAPAELRFQRYMQRKEKADDASLDFEGFMGQEKEATEIDIPQLGQSADFRIDNIGTTQELYEKIDAVINSVRG